jgi:TonB family protein
MKRILFLCCTVFVVAIHALAQPAKEPASWSRYTVKGEEFSVLLPTVPAMTTSKVRRKGDYERRVERQLETSLDGVLYMIQVFENPRPRQTLEQFIAEHRSTLELDPASERPFTVDGFSGKEYSSTDKKFPAVVQFLATETRLYRFTASGRGVEGGAARVFFSSIKLGKNTDGIKVSDGPGIPLELGGERINTGKEVDVKPRLLEKPEPSCTEEARRNRTAGTVILRVVFTSKGTVENIKIVRRLPDGLTERAIEAAKQITFVPATKDGHPVSMWMQLEYTFLP